MISTANEYQLFELERIEFALVSIFLAQSIPAQGKFDSTTDSTPRVELKMTFDGPEGHRFLRNPTNAFAPAQPFDSWLYTLSATVATERSQNGEQHKPLIGKTRFNLQYYRLIQSLTAAISPYHTLTSIDEVGGQVDSVDDTGNLQMSQLTFRGIMNIRADAWPIG